MAVPRVGAARYRAAPCIEPSKEAGLSAHVVPQSLVVAALRLAFGFFSAGPVGAGGQPVYRICQFLSTISPVVGKVKDIYKHKG
jgi:hypothetical protein